MRLPLPNHTQLKCLLAVFSLATAVTATAKDFEVNGISYNITSTEDRTVEVTGSQTYSTSNYSGGVTIPESVTYSNTTYTVTAVGAGAFIICDKLTSISLPATVKELKIGAFAGCTSLSSFNFPNSLSTIGEKCFEGCTGLTSITIPASVSNIGEYAFRSCSGLTSIRVESGNQTFDSRNGCNAIVRTATNELVVACQKTVIPVSVTSIGVAAYYGQTAMTAVSIPATVTSIGRRAFQGCTGLTAIALPANVASIGEYAFWGCANLTNVYTGVKAPAALATKAFEGVAANCSLAIPAGTKDGYTTAGWTEEVFGGGIAEVLYGDVNGDGSVDILDAAMIVYYVLGRTTDINLTAADVNFDASVDILDATIVVYQNVLGRNVNAAKPRQLSVLAPQ